MPTYVVDIEADGLLDTVTTIWCVGLFCLETNAYRLYGPDEIGAAIDVLESADLYVGHNLLGYDLLAIHRVTGRLLDPTKAYDTLVVGRLLEPERPTGHSLEAYGGAFGMPKGDHSDWTCFSPEMAAYMEQDVAITTRLYKQRLKQTEGWGESVQLEHEVAWVIALQVLNGFLLDVPRAEALAASLYGEQAELGELLQRRYGYLTKPGKPFVPKKDNKRMNYLAGSPLCKVTFEQFNPTSRPQIAKVLIEQHGWKPKTFTNTGLAEVSADALAMLKDPEVRDIERYLRIDKQLSQLAKPPKSNGKGGGWMHHMDANHRVHGSVNPNGAVTGRMTHFSPNLANVDKKDLEMRAVWIPRKGWVLVGCDGEGLELRMLGHYLYSLDGGAYATAVVEGTKEDGTDAHTRTQKIVGLHRRDGAKTFIYGLIYGAGNPKLGAIIVEDAREAGQPRPRKSMKALGMEARARVEDGIAGFGKLVEGVKRMANTRGWLRGLDGRRIYTRSAHSALNTLLQGGGAAVMKKALALFHARAVSLYGQPAPLNDSPRWAYCVNVHDEVQFECEPELAEPIGKLFAACITDAGVALGLKCPMSGAYSIGNNWAETH